MRKNRIESIMNSIKDAQEKRIIIDEKKFVLEIMLKFGVTNRKAKEYLTLARYALENEIQK